jgi:prepilin-type N-terminal cleavage/methylation domain-containing protein
MIRQFFCGLRKSQSGFSLAEVLICLALLGVLATFTVPSLLQKTNTDQASKYNAIVKNVAIMVTTAYERYKAANGSAPATMTMLDLMPYMNYVGVQTTGSVDGTPGNAPYTCSPYTCLKLHNGASIAFNSMGTLGGNTINNAMYFGFDPDGISGNLNGMELWLYYDGTIRDWSNLRSPTTQTWNGVNYPQTSNPANNPSWFAGF